MVGTYFSNFGFWLVDFCFVFFFYFPYHLGPGIYLTNQVTFKWLLGWRDDSVVKHWLFILEPPDSTSTHMAAHNYL